MSPTVVLLELELLQIVVVDARAEDEAGYGVKVSENGDGHDELGERPAELAFEQLGDVLFVDEPGLVAEELVDLVEVFEFGGYVVEAHEPVLLAVRRRELLLLLLDKVDAFVARGGHES